MGHVGCMGTIRCGLLFGLQSEKCRIQLFGYSLQELLWILFGLYHTGGYIPHIPLVPRDALGEVSPMGLASLARQHTVQN